MRILTIYLLFVTLLIGQTCTGQTLLPDSCGLDTNSILNKYEITFLDSVLFAPREFKKGYVFDFKNGFDFRDKKIAFYSGNLDINGGGFLTKEKFFKNIKPLYRGPRGLLVLSDKEKLQSDGYDAIIIISCKACSKDDIINKLKIHKK
jgi:hypothetical protein